MGSTTLRSTKEAIVFTWWITFHKSICSILLFTSIVGLGNSRVDAFEPYRVPGINPKCQPVTLSFCRPVVEDFTTGLLGGSRNKRLPSQHADNRNLQGKRRASRSIKLESDGSVGWKYNSTTFPNFANDQTPDDVIESLRQFHPLLATQCSKFVKLFLCSVYSPVCSDFGVVPPCRELCEKVKDDCAKTVETFGIQWPESVQCSFFPSYGNKGDVISEPMYEESMLSQGDDYTIVIQRAASLTWMEALAGGGKICIPPTDDDVISEQLERLGGQQPEPPKQKNDTSTAQSRSNHQFGLWCPAEMRSPPGQSGYSFLGMEDCSPPCPNMYLSGGELAGVRYLIVFMATVCILVTLFTLCTFLIDTKRFRYPERPIVFYALSYFIVSLIFLVGFILKEEVACNKEIRDENTHDIIQGFTVVKGDHKQTCTLMFMVLYYFTVNGTIWWLILTITWLLAAGFKWGSEAIEKYSLYYHITAWGIPAIQTMAVVTFSKIEGDNIAGVCFLGLYDSEALRYLLLAPLCVYLFVGVLILFTGFFCLNRVRKRLGDDEVNKKKLAKFMVRIGVFSIMFIIPQLVLLTIYVVEDSYRTQWEATWFIKSCSDYRVPCPSEDSSVTVLAGEYQPSALLFCLKYVMTLVVALPPLFWVASKKTLLSWQMFCCRGNRPQPMTQVHSNNNITVPSDTIVNNGSRKKLLPNDAAVNNKNHRPRSAGDGSLQKVDDVFGNFPANKLHGSSASVAALAVATEAERNSRQNIVIEDRVVETKAPNSEGEGSISRRKHGPKKEFPASMKRKAMRTNSTSTSSRITSSIHKPSSSLSSSASAQRRPRSRMGARIQQQTSSLERREFRAKRAPGVAKAARAASPLTTQPLTSRSAVATSEPNVSRPPVTAPRTYKNTVVTLPKTNFEATVEV